MNLVSDSVTPHSPCNGKTCCKQLCINHAIYRSSTPLPHYSMNELSNIDTINYQVKVTNTGKVGGQVSVLAYVTSDVRNSHLPTHLTLRSLS